MKILLATGHPYLPQIAGGAQSSMHELAHEFMARGHEVSVACGLSTDGMLAIRNRILMKLTRRRVIRDSVLGYNVFRAWFIWEALEEVIRAAQPDVVFAQSGFPVRIAEASRKLGIPVVIYLRNVEADDLGGDLSKFKSLPYVANSEFTARRFKEMFGITSTVVYPLFYRRRYEVETRRTNVAFVNPHPHKGSALALDIAERCPDIPFAFVEGWTLDRDIRDELHKRLASLPNVKLIQRSAGMSNVYREAKIVLVPSRWEEGFGRVVAEAHFSGIPAIASLRGGLPEAVGPGGVLLDPDLPTEHWVDALRRLWRDEEHYAHLSNAAREYSNRPALNRDIQVGDLLEILAEAVDGKTRQGHVAPT